MRDAHKPSTKQDNHFEEDDFLRPEHDPSSFINRLAQESPIISAPSVAFYALQDRFVIVIKRQTD